MATTTFTKCDWCGWQPGDVGGGCAGCLNTRRAIEEPPPARPVWVDRLGREMPLDADGRPECPRCHESRFVTVSDDGAYCRICRRDVRYVEPKGHRPDF